VKGKDNKPLPRFAVAGVTLARGTQPAITFTYFNMEDPVVGGYTNEKIALRRAIGMAYNVDEEVRVLRQGQGMPATQVIPPGVTGHDPKFSGHAKFDPQGANAQLDKFGYIDRDKDGWRDLPDGKPLVLKMGTSPSAIDRQFNELWQRNLTAIGVRVEFVNQKFADLLKMRAPANCRCGRLETPASRRRVTNFSDCSMAGFRGCRICRASNSQTSIASTTFRGACPTARSAQNTSGRCPRLSRRIRLGCSMRTGLRTSSCIRG
jgi:ABC-type transport system substrate-binding protein